MWYSTFTADDFDILWYVTYLKSAHSAGVMAIYNITAIHIYRTTQCLHVQHITATYLCKTTLYACIRLYVA